MKGYWIENEKGEALGDTLATVLPLPGDHVRTAPRGSTGSEPYEVVRREFIGDEVYVIVRAIKERSKAAHFL